MARDRFVAGGWDSGSVARSSCAARLGDVGGAALVEVSSGIDILQGREREVGSWWFARLLRGSGEGEGRGGGKGLSLRSRVAGENECRGRVPVC